MSRVMLAAVLVAMMLSATAACAAEGDVMMAGFLLLRVRCASPGMSVEQRADAIQTRANNLLVLGGFDLSTIKVVRVGAEAAVYADGSVLVTVDWCTARANHTTPAKLAQVWADRLRDIYPRVVPQKPPTEPTL